MSIMLEGLECLPSLIRVPKPRILDYKEVLNTKEYLSIHFYTLYQNMNIMIMQVLISWFDGARKIMFKKCENFV